MTKHDDGFDLDDVMDIFGGDVSLSKKEKEPAKSAVMEAPKKAPEKASLIHDEETSLSAEEMEILASYENQKKDSRKKEEEAAKKREEQERRILEEYERAKKESEQAEARRKKELEEKKKRELEELKKQDAFKMDEEEERRIIEEFEKEQARQKQQAEVESRAKEQKAQEELKQLAEKQKAEEATRRAEESRREEEFKKKASQVSNKQGRLMDLLARAQKDLEAAGKPALPDITARASAGGASSFGGSASPAAHVKEIDVSSMLGDVGEKENHSFVFMLDESRKTMFTFLAPSIGIRAANNMLNKTVEKARAQAPAVLKDVNWNIDGSLRDDGSIDAERLYRNAQALPLGKRVETYLEGLRIIVQMRIKAVEAGLGKPTSDQMHSKLMALKKHYIEKHIPQDLVDIFLAKVLA